MTGYIEHPWTCYGQTQPIVNGAIDNPPTNKTGIRGEADLPYTVPEGYELVLEAYGGEAYGGTFDGLVYVPWVGIGEATNAKCLHSVFSDNASNETVGVRFHIPAGKTLNYRIMSKENVPQVVGWYMRGTLIPVPAAT